MTKSLFKVLSVLTIFALVLMSLPLQSAQADNTAQSLPFSQDWTNTGLITADDVWSGVPGIIGYRGDGLTGGTAVDPQTVVADGTGTPVDVNANQTNPNTFTTGGVAEFHIANPVVAFQGSGTARAPFLLLHLNTAGFSSITVSYNLRDIDGSTDNAVQPVALQYRVGSTGNFTNLPAGFVSDASTGPSLATLVTPVSVVLPAAANFQPLVQVRIITTDAVGADELIGVDDITVTGDNTPTATATDTPLPTDTPTPTDTPVFTDTPTNTPTDTPVPTDTATSTPSSTPVTAAALVINEIDYDQPGTDTAEFVEIRNNDVVSVDLSGYNIQMIN